MKIDHVAINVRDIEKSVEWYMENIGGRILYKDETWALLRMGGAKIALTVASQHKPHIGFRVDNLIDFDTEEIKKHRDGARYVYREDPDGNVIEWVCY
jgi:catechol 2,3-dioxygenase-like lactoylglutathione lyase family enzyme